MYIRHNNKHAYQACLGHISINLFLETFTIQNEFCVVECLCHSPPLEGIMTFLNVIFKKIKFFLKYSLKLFEVDQNLKNKLEASTKNIVTPYWNRKK